MTEEESTPENTHENTQEPKAEGTAEEASEEKIEEQQTVSEEPKPMGLARVPNREKGSNPKPPFIMIGIFVGFAVLSLILAKVL